MDKLLILAYNEELYIENTVSQYVDYFSEIIVVNDCSVDSTGEILANLSKKYENLTLLNNPTNIGAGASMNRGVEKALESDFNYLVKIDGDNQFRNNDITKILEVVHSNKSDYVKSDRFWSGGIEGKIPKIRYVGNAFASFLIKFITSNSNINDPLNGFFVFSKKAAEKLIIPKRFFRYGYPFYINSFFYKISLNNNLNLHQINNIVTYENENSYIKPIVMFVKLIKYSIKFYFQMINVKLKFSSFQMSGLLDIISIFSIVISVTSLIRSLGARFFSIDANQSAWFIISILFIVVYVALNIGSRSLLRNYNKKVFMYLKI